MKNYKNRVNHIITEFERQEVIKCNANMLSINKPRVRMLQLWSSGVRDFTALLHHRQYFRKESCHTTCKPRKRQSICGTTSICVTWHRRAGVFDKAVFSAFIASLKQEGYFNEEGIANTEKLNEITEFLNQVISTEVCLTIKGAIAKIEEE